MPLKIPSIPCRTRRIRLSIPVISRKLISYSVHYTDNRLNFVITSIRCRKAFNHAKVESAVFNHMLELSDVSVNKNSTFQFAVLLLVVSLKLRSVVYVVKRFRNGLNEYVFFVLFLIIQQSRKVSFRSAHGRCALL